MNLEYDDNVWGFDEIAGKQVGISPIVRRTESFGLRGMDEIEGLRHSSEGISMFRERVKKARTLAKFLDHDHEDALVEASALLATVIDSGFNNGEAPLWSGKGLAWDPKESSWEKRDIRLCSHHIVVGRNAFPLAKFEDVISVQDTNKKGKPVAVFLLGVADPKMVLVLRLAKRDDAQALHVPLEEALVQSRGAYAQ